MQLYARRTSSNCQKVLWLLGELELPYELIPTGGDAGGLDAPAYRALNPNGRVPTLVDGGLAIWESHTILRYLAATRAAERFWSPHPAERSQFERWMDWSQAQLDASFMSLFWGHWRTPEAQRDEKRNRLELARCRHFLSILDAALSDRRFLLGDRLTLADVPAGSLMYRYANLDVTDELPPNVARWYEALCERAAYREHVMIPFDELRGRLTF